MKLIQLLLSSKALTHRTVKPRFWWLVAVVVIILGVVFWDKLGIMPQSFVTSIYWKGTL